MSHVAVKAVVLMECHLNLTEIRVLWFLIAHVRVRNRVSLRTKEIASGLGIAMASVSRALRVLQDWRLIWKSDELGEAGAWIINPRFVWRGGRAEHIAAHNAAPEIEYRPGVPPGTVLKAVA